MTTYDRDSASRLGGEPRARTPIVKPVRIGERFVGAVVDLTQRQQKDQAGAPLFKPDGKPKNELVVTLAVMPGSTMHVGVGRDDDPFVPEAGTTVRMIVKGLTWSAWIEAEKAVNGVRRGDVVRYRATHGQAYSGNGGETLGPPLTTDDAIIAQRMKGRTVGIYGELTLAPGDAVSANLAATAQRAAAPTLGPTPSTPEGASWDPFA